MAAKRKSWREKLADTKGLPRVTTILPRHVRTWGLKPGDTMVLPAPLEVDALMKRVPKGKVVTINELRAALSRKHKTTTCCPMLTGIFAWIAANAADEARHAGIKRITPYWRTLKARGELNPKFPGGAA